MTPLVALLLSASATDGASQSTAPTRSQEAARRLDEGTRQVISRYGKCVVRRRPGAASAFVLGEKAVELEEPIFDEVNASYCFSLSGWDGILGARFPRGTLRYTLAEALVLREYSGRPFPSFAQVPPLPRFMVDPADFRAKPGSRPSKQRDQWLEQARKEAAVAAFMYSYGECVVRSDPMGSYRLLMTEVTSAQEAIEFGKLKPTLAACIPNQQKMGFNKATIRGAMALTYYRLAKAPRLPAASDADGFKN